MKSEIEHLRAPAGVRRPSLCFVAPSAYPVLARRRDLPFVGGAEVQQALIAAELARRGYPVSMICMDQGQPEGETVDGVRVLKAYAPDAGVPVLRFLHPRLTSVWSAMKRAGADIYYQRTRGMLAGVVARYARAHGKASIFAAANDADFFVTRRELRYARDRWMYRWGVRRVDAVIVQTERQRDLCRREYGREAAIVRSCVAHAGRPAAHDGPVLWVATAKGVKQPHLFVELAARLPQYRFKLVGGPEASAAGRRYYEELRDRAQGVPNLELTGFVPYADIEAHFDGASVFVNTALREGFPNTFLQAWSRGMPTVSFFDPQSALDGQPVGCVVADLDQMARTVAALKSDPARWQATGARARRLVDERHSLASVADAYEAVIDRLVRRRRTA